MQTPAPVPNVEVRVVLIEPSSKMVAVLRVEQELPRVWIPECTRVARAVQAAVLAMWGVRAFVLRRLSADSTDVLVIAAELMDYAIPAAWEFVESGHISERIVPQAEREELTKLVSANHAVEVGALGWLHEARAWIEEQIHIQIDSECLIEQFNGGAAYTLVRFVTTTGGAYWLKATSPLNGHELAMTSLLGRLGTDSTPEVIAIHKEWNAWLMPEVGTPFRHLSAIPGEVERTLCEAVQSLASVQRGTLADEEMLFEAGAFDQRLARLQSDAPQLFEHLELAIAAPACGVPLHLANNLTTIATAFAQACDRALELPIPAALLHGDLTLANLAFSTRGCQILDWSESYVGFPLTSLQHLLLLNSIHDRQIKDAINQRLVNTYFSMMAECLPTSVLAKGLQLTPIIAAMSALYGRGDWIGGKVPHTAHRLRFARIILPHLDTATESMRNHRTGGLPC